MKALQSTQNANGHRGGNGGGRDSSFRRTYDDNDKKRAIPCENCALTLPRKTGETGGGSSTSAIPDPDSPILRTRKPFERVVVAGEQETPGTNSQGKQSNRENTSSEEGDSDTAVLSSSNERMSPRRQSRVGTTKTTSETSSNSLSHKHYLDYTSTHEPLSSASFSIIRQSCLRTLSCETLPPSSATPSPSSASPSSPLSPNNNSSSSGGPIFFGDPHAGFTTAYIFRIPDPNARGRRRVYALMALSTHRERVAMQTFSLLAAAFRDLAAWIQGLAEAHSDSLAGGGGGGPKGVTSSSGTPNSSFLSGRSGGSGGRNFGELSLRSRGLAELVGLPDFFLELHMRFVRLLIEMGLVMGTS